MEKKTYVVRISVNPATGKEIMINNDTNEPITGRITLAGMVLVGTRLSGFSKLLLVFEER
jgi:hypothetical protein